MSNFRVTNVFKASVFFVFLMFGLFAPKVFGDTNVASAATTIGNISADAKTKLLFANGVYNLGFTSSTADGYRLFFATSTDGVSWSEPYDIFQRGISQHAQNDDTLDGLFDLINYGDTNFAAAIYVTGTTDIWYAKSENSGSTWATSTAVSGISGQTSKLYLDFTDDNLMGVLFFSSGNSSGEIGVATSSGGNFSTTSSYLQIGPGTAIGAKVTGNIGSPIYHVGYFDISSDLTSSTIGYASSSDFGATWSTSTAVTNTKFYVVSEDAYLSFRQLNSFNLDSDGNPAFLYFLPTDAALLTPPPDLTLNATTSIMYAHKSGGVWVNSTVATNVPWNEIPGFVESPSDLTFFNTTPIISGPGPSFAPFVAYSTTTDVWASSDMLGTLFPYTDISSVYNNTASVLASSYVSDTGDLIFSTSSASISAPAGNTAPSATAISPVFSSYVTGLVTVTTTITDDDGNTVSLNVDYSIDGGSTWASSTIGSTSAGTSTVAGTISGITNTLAGNAMTFTWDTLSDGIFNTNVTALLRITPNDGTVNGSAQTSASFAVNNFNGNLPVVNEDAKIKLLLVNGVYSLGFSSSTDDGSYHLYFTTSTSGADNSWSEPADVFDFGITADASDGGVTNGLFDLEYNSVGGYFAATIFATGTENIWFATSTSGLAGTWATSTAVSNTGADGSAKRILFLDFSSSDNLGAIFYNVNSRDVNVATSTDDGANWISGTALGLNPNESPSLLGGRITGTALSHVFHVGYFVNSSTQQYGLFYATSTNGTSWTSSTAVTGAAVFFDTNDVSYSGMMGFDLDSNLVPAFTYFMATALGPLDTPPFDTTSTLVYVDGNDSGGWNPSSTVATGVHWQITNTRQRASSFFFNDTVPVFVGMGPESAFAMAVNTSTWNTLGFTGNPVLPENAGASAVYSTSSQILAGAYVLASTNRLSFSTSSLDLNVAAGGAEVPTITSIDQNTTSSMRVNWTVDPGGTETEFVVQASEDGGSTYSTVTTTPTTTLSFVVDALATPNTQYFFRVIASSTDSQANSSIASGYTSSTDPVSLVASAVSTSSLTLTWGENGNPTSTDYQIFATGFTTTTVENATTTNLTGLSPSTSYTFYVRAQNAGNTTTYSGTTSVATTTLASEELVPAAPTSLSISNLTTSSVSINWTSGNGDENIFFLELSSDGGLTFPDSATTSAASTSVVIDGLSPNSQHAVRLSAAIEGVSTSTATTTTFYTLSTAPISLVASAVTTSSLTLTWDVNGNPSTTVYHVDNGITSTTIATNTIDIDSLVPNTEYTFVVKAQNAGNTSTYSATTSVVTTTLAVIVANNAPTVSAIYPVFATNGTGLVTVTTTVADGDGDTVSLNVDYSLDSGSTWASSTIGSTSAGTSAASGIISGITSTLAGNAMTFTWDSQTDGVTTTATAQLRITPSDATEAGSTVSSSDFTVDNEAPAVPTVASVTPTTSTVALVWGDVSGAATYTVSSTAASATTTVNTTTTFIDLNANSLYSFQVKATDAYGNVSAFSTATSTYTDVNAPVSVADSLVTATTLTLSWGANSNSGTTIYRVSGDNSFTAVTTTEVTKDLVGLTPNTVYNFDVQALSASDGVTYSASSSLSTTTLAAVPTALTATVSSTTQIDLDWDANSNPGTTVYDVYNVTDATTATTTATSYSVTGLITNTSYQFAIRAANASGGYSAYTATSTATTTFGLPTVASVAASSVSTSTVTFNGNITAIGGQTVTARGFVYGTSTDYGTTSTDSGSYGTGAFTAEISSLDPATPYHYKAFASNSVGIAYGDDIALITLSAPTADNPTTTITSANTATTTISVSSDVTNAVIDLSSLTGSNSSTLPGALAVDLATTLGTIQLSMPSGTQITADDTWTGTFILPTVQSNSSVGDVSDDGYTATVSGVVEVGYGDVAFTLSSAARLLVPDMSGKSAGYYRDNAFTQITTACSADVQATVDSQLSAGGDCKIDVGSDLVIWTKHFTKFAAYSQTQNAVVAAPRSGGGGGSSAPAPSAPITVAPVVVSDTFSVVGSKVVMIGNVSHKVTVSKINAAANEATFSVESTPIVFTLKVTEEKLLDTDRDGVNDLRVKLNSISAANKTVDLTIVSIADLQFSINHFAVSTNNRDVTLYFNSPDAIQMAISEIADLDDASYMPYSKTKAWRLSAGNGEKTLYVKFRTKFGGIAIVQSSINLTGSAVVSTPVVPPASSVSFTFKKNLSFGNVNNDVKQLQMVLKDLGFFTYPSFTLNFGPATRNAVKAFQKANGIKPVNGLVGPLTRGVLNSLAGTSVEAPVAKPVSTETTKFTFKKNLSFGNVNNDVKQLQMVLKELGFFTYPQFTTRFGAVTRDAVKAFQKANGIAPVNGLVGPLTRGVLNSL